MDTLTSRLQLLLFFRERADLITGFTRTDSELDDEGSTQVKLWSVFVVV